VRATGLAALALLSMVVHATTVDGVRVHEAPDYTRVVLDTSAPVAFELFTLENPHRVVVDVRQTRAGAGLDTRAAALAGTSVRAIRGAPRGNDLRIVLETTHALSPKGFTLAPVAPYVTGWWSTSSERRRGSRRCSRGRSRGRYRTRRAPRAVS
jgi:N-acetylmuramoyl-L-alanine amidase